MKFEIDGCEPAGEARKGDDGPNRANSIHPGSLPFVAVALAFFLAAGGAFADVPGGGSALAKAPLGKGQKVKAPIGRLAQSKQPKVDAPKPASSIALRRFGQEIRHLYRAEGKIGSSLHETGLKRSVPAKIMREMVEMLGYLVDFQRDLKPNHTFVVIFEQFLRPDGTKGRVGKLVYAGIQLQGKRYGVWSFRLANGRVDYFNSQGRSVRTALLRTPINGAAISSNFGLRKHPILGYTRLHRGVDFAAAKGTPIYASGDGEVEEIGRSTGGLGNHVRIRHSSGYSTVYGHMSKVNKGLRAGQKVRQGQIIGLVGSTGLSTGPHLHYEVWRDGEAIDPAGLKLQTRMALAGDALTKFRWQAALVMMKPATRIKPPAGKTAQKR